MPRVTLKVGEETIVDAELPEDIAREVAATVARIVGTARKGSVRIELPRPVSPSSVFPSTSPTYRLLAQRLGTGRFPARFVLSDGRTVPGLVVLRSTLRLVPLVDTDAKILAVEIEAEPRREHEESGNERSDLLEFLESFKPDLD